MTSRDFWFSLAMSAACLAPALFAGCADGPVPEMRYLNPWIRKQWEEDEKEGPTYYRKVADLGRLQSQARSLSPEQQEQTAAELAQRLRDEKSPVMRAELVRTLAEFPSTAARDAVQAAMTDESAHVRVAACKALGRQTTPEGFQALSQAVAGDADLDVRIAATRELGRYQQPETAQALRTALDDNDPALQVAAMDSLKTLTGRKEYGNSVATWREYLDGSDPAPPPAPSIAEVMQKYWNWY